MKPITQIHRARDNKYRGRDKNFGQLDDYSDQERVAMLRELVDLNTEPTRLRELCEIFFTPKPAAQTSSRRSSARRPDKMLERARALAQFDSAWFFAEKSKGGPLARGEQVLSQSPAKVEYQAPDQVTHQDHQGQVSLSVTQPQELSQLVQFDLTQPLHRHLKKWLNPNLTQEQKFALYREIIETPDEQGLSAAQQLCPGVKTNAEVANTRGRPPMTLERVVSTIKQAFIAGGERYVYAKRGVQLKRLFPVTQNHPLAQAVQNYALANISQSATQSENLPNSSANSAKPVTTPRYVTTPKPVTGTLSSPKLFSNTEQALVKLKQFQAQNPNRSYQLDYDLDRYKRVQVAMTTRLPVSASDQAVADYYRNVLSRINNLEHSGDILQSYAEAFQGHVLYDCTHLNWAHDCHLSQLAPIDLDKKSTTESVKLGVLISAATGCLLKAQLVEGPKADLNLIRELKIPMSKVILTGDKAFGVTSVLGDCSTRNQHYLFNKKLDAALTPVVLKLIEEIDDNSAQHMSVTYGQYLNARTFSAAKYRDYLLGDFDAETYIDAKKAYTCKDANYDIPAEIDCLDFINARQKLREAAGKSHYYQSNQGGQSFYHLYVRVTGEALASLKDRFENEFRTEVEEEKTFFDPLHGKTYVRKGPYCYACYGVRGDEEFTVAIAWPKRENIKKAQHRLATYSHYVSELNAGKKVSKAQKQIQKDIITKSGNTYFLNRTKAVGSLLKKVRIFVTNIKSSVYQAEKVTGAFRFAELIYSLYRRRWMVEIFIKSMKKITKTLNCRSKEDAAALISLMLMSISLKNLSECHMMEHSRKRTEKSKVYQVPAPADLNDVVKSKSGYAIYTTNDGINYSGNPAISYAKIKQMKQQCGFPFASAQRTSFFAQFALRDDAIEALTSKHLAKQFKAVDVNAS